MNEMMLDNPASRDQLIRAMEAAGYHYDELESTPDNLRFFGEGGNTMTMGGWKECEDWLNGVVFDDPQVSDYVETILHPAQIPTGAATYVAGRPEQNPFRALEDYLEQNDNSFDGILNNMPEPAKTTPAQPVPLPTNLAVKNSALEEDEKRESVLEQLRRQREADYAAHQEKPTLCRCPIPEERSLV